MTKRGFDLLFATVGLVMMSPVLAVIAVWVAVDSPGPPLFRQERVGRHGRPFKVVKFRTMRVDQDRTAGLLTADNDHRVTRAGRFLRRSKLDELPQLVNVVKGEMSLVGPRPERPFFVQSFSQKLPGYARRHQVLPGITGWAQINGWRGDSSLERRLECDLYYIDHWSVPFNLRILLLTPFKVLVERNAC